MWKGDLGRDAKMFTDHAAQELKEKRFPLTGLGQFPYFPKNSSAGRLVLAIPQMC